MSHRNGSAHRDGAETRTDLANPGRTGRRRVVTGAVLVALLSLAFGIGTALAAVTPDSACGTESTFKSTAGVTSASLLVINNTGETLQTFWLNYDGERVFYKEVAPFTSYVQPTWLTHPWVVANKQGACYRFLVMNSVQQTVTVNPDEGTSQTAAPPTAPPTVPSTVPPTNQPTNSPSTLAAGGLGNPTAEQTGGWSFPMVFFLIAVVLMLAAIGGLAATGHLPGFSKDGWPWRGGKNSGSGKPPG